MPITHYFEVFLTKHCGWGVRCRNDLPGGAFICCYMGHVLNEERSNKMAKKYGDAYLASLDFIETTENLKNGYESEVIESESDEAPPRKKQRNAIGSATIGRELEKIDNRAREFTENTRSTRQLIDSNATEYVIDAKRYGNLGRFFNVSTDCLNVK